MTRSCRTKRPLVFVRTMSAREERTCVHRKAASERVANRGVLRPPRDGFIVPCSPAVPATRLGGKRRVPVEVRRIKLPRRVSALLSPLIIGVGGVALVSFSLFAPSDSSMSLRLVPVLYGFAMATVGFAGFLFFRQPLDIEAGPEGLSLYRNGRLHRALSWGQVAWVSCWERSMRISLPFADRAVVLFVCGTRRLTSIGANNIIYQISAPDLADFATFVTAVARSHSIAVLPRPRV
jgi:hypothetical protein